METIQVEIFNNGFDIKAGSDDEICETEYDLQGQHIVDSKGLWISLGDAVVKDNTLYNSHVTGLVSGNNNFIWSVTYNGCEASEQVVIKSNVFSVYAGADYSACITSYNISGTNLGNGTGLWTTYGGNSVVQNTTTDNTIVTNLDKKQNTLIWTVIQNGCTASDEIVLTNNIPSVPEVQPVLPTCDNFATISATNPDVGNGTWSIVSSEGKIQSPSRLSTQVTNLNDGANIFQWTIENNGCELSQNVTIQSSQITDFDAGKEQVICVDNATLKADNPADFGATGEWISIGGTADIDDETAYNTTVTNLNRGPNTFQWTVSKNGCTTIDKVIVNNNYFETDAGEDDEICEAFFNLDGKELPDGATDSQWTSEQGGGIFTNSTLNESTVTDLNHETYIFRWTVQSKGCTAFDEVVVTNNIVTANAGTDPNTECSSTNYLKADATTLYGYGTWTKIGASQGEFANNTMAETTVTELGAGENTFRWTITNNSCISTDDVVIDNATPTNISAGADQTICGDFTDLEGSIPPYGLGQW